MQDVRRSFDRAKERNFAKHFYDIFLTSDAAVRAKFRNTDFEQQRALLIHGVYSMLDFAEGNSMGKLALTRLAVRHGPGGLNVTRPMYEKWLECFVLALARTDPEFTPALKERWLASLRPAIEHLLRNGR
jgi:hypothetical protein